MTMERHKDALHAQLYVLARQVRSCHENGDPQLLRCCRLTGKLAELMYRQLAPRQRQPNGEQMWAHYFMQRGERIDALVQEVAAAQQLLPMAAPGVRMEALGLVSRAYAALQAREAADERLSA